MEDSPIALGDWLIVGWMLGSCRNGISSYEVARTIGITQKSAWFMLHRLREAMLDPLGKLSGVVEMDEAYFGGQTKNKHVKVRKQGKHKDKTSVLGVVERGGRVVATVMPSVQKEEVHALLKSSVDESATTSSRNWKTCSWIPLRLLLDDAMQR